MTASWARRCGALIVAAAFLALAGCQSSQAVSRSFECTKDREYSAPGTPACGQHGRTSQGAADPAAPAR